MSAAVLSLLLVSVMPLRGPPAPAPPPVQLADLQRFPPKDCSLDMWREATTCRSHWAECPPLCWRDEERLEHLRHDSFWCWECWDALTDAQLPIWEDEEIARRLQKLEHLRDLLGPEAYAAGWMPPPVPLWRYVEVP